MVFNAFYRRTTFKSVLHDNVQHIGSSKHPSQILDILKYVNYFTNSQDP